MSVRIIDVRGRKVAVAEAGSGGPPLVYLHGFADVHGVAGDLLPFHLRLAQHARVIAPAHPGCNGSDELDSASIDDVVFHYLELFDAPTCPASTWSAIAPAAGSRPRSRCGIPSGWRG